MSDWQLVFEDAPEEAAYPLDEGDGEVPPELRGVFLRNGPGIQRLGDDRLHLLDGQGFVGVLQLGDGRASFRGRLVGSKGFEAERAAGRQLDRRAFTNLPSRWSNLMKLRIANPYNHDVVAWAGRLLACDAPGYVALDPDTLNRAGTSPIAAICKPPASVAPMPRYDPTTDRLVVYQVVPGLRSDTLAVHELDREGSLHCTASHGLPRSGAVLHDAVATPDHLVVLCFGYASISSVAWGARPVIDAIRHDPAGTVSVFVVPRGPSGTVREVALPAGHQGFHVFNAYETDGKLILHAVIYDGRVDFVPLYPPGMPGVGPTAPVKGPFVARMVLDLGTGEAAWEKLDASGEAPDVDPRRHGLPHRYGWAVAPVGRGDEPVGESYFWFHGLVRVDFVEGQHQTWSAGERVFCSPPAFAPRSGGTEETDGWVLTWLLDAEHRRSGVAIFDAADLSQGPICRRWLKHLLPAVSHTSWSSDLQAPR